MYSFFFKLLFIFLYCGINKKIVGKFNNENNDEDNVGNDILVVMKDCFVFIMVLS